MNMLSSSIKSKVKKKKDQSFFGRFKKKVSKVITRKKSSFMLDNSALEKL